jgi:hypothetical protein
MFSQRPKRAPRKVRDHGAWIMFDGDIRSYECCVLNDSAGGARLLADVDALVGSSMTLSAAPHSMLENCAKSFGEEGGSSASSLPTARKSRYQLEIGDGLRTQYTFIPADISKPGAGFAFVC